MKYFRRLGPIILALGAAALFLLFLLALAPSAGAAEAAPAASEHDRIWGQFGNWAIVVVVLTQVAVAIRAYLPGDKFATKEDLQGTKQDVAAVRGEMAGLRTEMSNQSIQRERDYREIKEFLHASERRQQEAAEQRAGIMHSRIDSLAAAVHHQEGQNQVIGTLTDYHRQKANG
jgi:hypothetical protein